MREEKLVSNNITYKEQSYDKGRYLLLLLLTAYTVLVFFTSKYGAPSFFITVIFIQLFLLVAPKLGFMDVPNYRSSHTCTTPKCGVALFVALIIASLFTDLQINDLYSNTLLAIFLVFFLGVYDDLKGSRARYKILIIFSAALLAIADGLTIQSLGTYFSHNISLYWLSYPVTIIAIVGFTNSLNLIDGLDGLAATIGIIILTSLSIIGFKNNDLFIIGVTSVYIPILIAFLFFNWNPARAFMGDCGSLTLGFVIAILSIKALDYVSPIVILYIVAIPVIDTIVTMLRRWKNHQPIFSADKKHMHHILLDKFNGSVPKTVLFISLIQLTYASIGLLFVTTLQQEISFTLLICSIIIWYLYLTHQSKENAKDRLGHKIS